MPIVAGGYFLEIEVPKKVAERIAVERERDEQERQEQRKRNDEQERQEQRMRNMELSWARERAMEEAGEYEKARLSEDPRSLRIRLRHLDAEIAKRNAVLARVGDMDPTIDGPFCASVLDYRDELRKLIKERETLLQHPAWNWD